MNQTLHACNRNMTAHRFSRRCILCAALLCLAVAPALAQWDVREFAAHSDKNPGADRTFPGKFENTRHKELAWYIPGKKGDDRIQILDLSTGEVRWKSKPYFHISPTSISVTDIDGDGIDELIFSGQAESTDDASLFMVNYKEIVSSSLAAAPLQANAPMQASSGPSHDASTSSTSPSQSTPAPPPETAKEVVTLIPESATALLQYSVAQKGVVKMDIFNGQGDLVRTLINTEMDPGEYSKSWNGTNDQGTRLPVGTYFYKVSVGNSTQARRPVVFSR